MQGQGLLGLIAKLADDPLQLLRVGDLENEFFPALLLPGQPVKAEAKGPVKQLGQALCKLGIFGDNSDLPGVKGVAVEQNAVGLRPGAANTLHRYPAQFTFHLIGKGLHTSSYFSMRFRAWPVLSSTTRMVRWR